MTFLSKKLAALFLPVAAILTGSTSGADAEPALDYEDMILLDAEDLAEEGMARAYAEISQVMTKYIARPEAIHESPDHETGTYSVSYSGGTFEIYGAAVGSEIGESWARATVALFEIVNSQLTDTQVKFYAFYGGNDLGGMFLTQAEVDAARRSLRERRYWPYLPVMEHPWYGQFH